jgi:hypothetical protein
MRRRCVVRPLTALEPDRYALDAQAFTALNASPGARVYNHTRR